MGGAVWTNGSGSGGRSSHRRGSSYRSDNGGGNRSGNRSGRSAHFLDSDGISDTIDRNIELTHGVESSFNKCSGFFGNQKRL